MTVAVVAETSVFNRMRTAWFANAAETQAPFYRSKGSKPAERHFAQIRATALPLQHMSTGTA